MQRKCSATIEVLQTDQDSSSPTRRSGFATTCWTQVIAARGESPESRSALSDLCKSYYEPVVAYLRRAGYDRDGGARDLAHGFFGSLLEGTGIARLERGETRFRSYLLGALKHFLAHEWRREQTQKRGGGKTPISLDEVDSPTPADPALPPDAWFDQQWAVTLIERALDALEAECEADGNATAFRNLTPWLTGEAEHGDQAELAERAGIPRNTLKSTIHRLRRRFRKAVKAEVERTLADGGDVEEEMSALFAALGGG